MDYYAAWPAWRMPKWIAALLGGVFTLILFVSIGLIIHLTRPTLRLAAPQLAAAVVTAPPVVAAQPTAVQPAAAQPSLPKPVAPAAEPKAEAPVVAHAETPVAHKRHAKSHRKTRPILAKQDAKGKHSTQSELDRLLGGL